MRGIGGRSRMTRAARWQAVAPAREIRRLRQLLPASVEIRSDQHGRTPSIAHCTGRIRIPSARAAAIAGAGSSGPRKTCSRRRRSRLPCRRAHRSRASRLETAHLRGAHGGIECLLLPPVLAQELSDPRQVARLEGFGHSFGDIVQGGEGSGHGGIPTLVRRHDPCDRPTGEPRRSRVDRGSSDARARSRRRHRPRRSTSASGSRKRKPQEAAVRRHELVLASAGDACFDGLEPARQVGDRSGVGASPRAEDSALTSATSRAPELPSPDPAERPNRSVTLQAPTGRRRTPAERRASGPARPRCDASGTSRLSPRSRPRVELQEPRAGLLRGHRARSRRRRPSRPLGRRTAARRSIHRRNRDEPARRHERSRSSGDPPVVHGRHSPRMSIVTPRTLRFIPCSPRA